MPILPTTAVPAAAPEREVVAMAEPRMDRAAIARLLGQPAPAGDAGTRTVIRLDASGRARVISSAALARHAGFAAPAGPRAFEILYRPARRDEGCSAAARAVARGHVLAPADLIEAPCAGMATGQLGFDAASGGVHAIRDIAAGARLGHVALRPAPLVARGAVLTLRSTVGPVAIERQVTALQPGDAARAIFVHGLSGPAFAVTLAGAGK